MNQREYPYHPAAELFPLLQEPELKKLAEDIRRRGLIHPILVYQNQILDGRNRLLGCKLAKVAPRYEQVDTKIDEAGISPLEYVVSLNLRRRQMNASQAAMAAAMAMPEWVREGRGISRLNLGQRTGHRDRTKMGRRGRSDRKLGKLFGVSPTYVTDAAWLRRKHTDLAESVFGGIYTLSRAVRLAKERDAALRRAKENDAQGKAGWRVHVIAKDVRDLATSWNRRKIDLIVTDPPYSADNLPLWTDLGKLASKALRPGGFLVALGGLQFAPDVMDRISHGNDIHYYWTICVRLLGSNGRRHGLGIVSMWRPFLVFYKPPFLKPPRMVLDFVTATLPVAKTHKWEQRPETYHAIIKNFSSIGDWVLDPFGGSGSVGEACRDLGRNAIVSDIDALSVAKIRTRLGVISAKRHSD